MKTRFLCCSLLSLTLVAGNAMAANPRATDAAFAALLSMPSAKPAQGAWNFPEPDGFEATSETALIAYLARQQKAGADVNAYRHHGTLLHHAIRAGTVKTATWLLEHGADPKLAVRGSGEDALALSVKYKRGPLAKMLQEKYGMVAGTPRPGGTAAPATPAQQEEGKVTSVIYKHGKTPASLQALLAAMPRAALQQHATAALDALGRVASLSVDEKTGKMSYAVPAESWRILWQYLGKPLDYGVQPGLAGKLQPELWPDLIAGGYPHTRAEEALGCLLANIHAPALKALWPQLIAQFPDIRQAAPRMVLSTYRMQGSYYCNSWNEEATRAKLQLLTSLGVNEPVTGLAAGEMKSVSAALKAAMQPFVRPPRAGKPRFVDAESQCTFALNDRWFSALMRKEGWPVDSAQLIEVPGAAECALLVGGYERGDSFETGLVDSFTGPEYVSMPSCVDAADAYEVWRQIDGRIVRLASDQGHDDSGAPLTLVRDTVSGKRYYLNDGSQHGKCGRSRLPFLFEWRKEGLLRSHAAELEDALFEQCSQPDYHVQCPGIAVLAPVGRSEAGRQIGDSTLIDSFLRRHGAAQLKQYLAAVIALDKDTLKAIQARGIPGSWTADAIKAVGASRLPLAEKRKRTAWLFYDHVQLEQAMSGDLLQSLLAWLPYEDWRPVVEAAARRHGGILLDTLREGASAKGLGRLACDVDNARGWLCGETISAER